MTAVKKPTLDKQSTETLTISAAKTIELRDQDAGTKSTEIETASLAREIPQPSIGNASTVCQETQIISSNVNLQLSCKDTQLLDTRPVMTENPEEKQPVRSPEEIREPMPNPGELMAQMMSGMMRGFKESMEEEKVRLKMSLAEKKQKKPKRKKGKEQRKRRTRKNKKARKEVSESDEETSSSSDSSIDSSSSETDSSTSREGIVELPELGVRGIKSSASSRYKRTQDSASKTSTEDQTRKSPPGDTKHSRRNSSRSNSHDTRTDKPNEIATIADHSLRGAAHVSYGHSDSRKPASSRVVHRLYVHDRHIKFNFVIQPMANTTVLVLGDSNMRVLDEVPAQWEVHSFSGARYEHLAVMILTMDLSGAQSLQYIAIQVGINHRDESTPPQKHIQTLFGALNRLQFKPIFMGVPHGDNMPSHLISNLDKLNEELKLTSGEFFVTPLETAKVTMLDPTTSSSDSSRYDPHYTTGTAGRVIRKLYDFINDRHGQNTTTTDRHGADNFTSSYRSETQRGDGEVDPPCTTLQEGTTDREIGWGMIVTRIDVGRPSKTECDNFASRI